MTSPSDTTILQLPPEMDGWEKDHGKVMEHLRRALEEAEAPFTETQLWNLVARIYSPNWAEARATLQDAQQKIDIHKSHENRALGAIGMALESDTINEELNNHTMALAMFTIVDEELHQDVNLRKLLAILVENQRMLEESIKLSRGIADVTAAFGEVASPDSVSVNYASPLQKTFGKLAKRIFRKKEKDTSPKGNGI